MPLNVSYKNRIGYYTETQKIGNTSKKYKIWICHANCLCAMMYFYNEVKEGKKVKKVQLVNFLADIPHLKRCKDFIFQDCSNFHFKAKQMDSDLWKMVKVMTSWGIKVTIE